MTAAPTDPQSVSPGGAPPRPAERSAVPRWAWALAAALLLAGLAVLVWGRGGTAVLAGAGLLFASLATVLLSLPDGDPGAG